MKIRDYQCIDCGNLSETYLGNDPAPQCHECGGATKYIITGTSFTLEGVSGSFPGAHLKWDKKRAQKMKQEQAKGITAFGQPNH